MSLSIQPSFSSGELDPALHERTNLQKYKSALATAKNVVVGKTGRLISRPARRHLYNTDVNNVSTNGVCIIHPLVHLGRFIEFGAGYVDLYNLAGTLLGSTTHAITEVQLENVVITQTSATLLMICCNPNTPLFLNLSGSFVFVSDPTLSITYGGPPAVPVFILNAQIGGAPASYSIQHVVTIVVNGQESLPLSMGTSLLPITVTQYVQLQVRVPVTGTTEMRVYRRPTSSGAYGYIGSSTYSFTSGAFLHMQFDDHGQEADYSHGPPAFNPTMLDQGLATPLTFVSACAMMYQQRLMLSYNDRIEVSRVGFPYNWYRDYPLSSESSLSLKANNGFSVSDVFILRLIEKQGAIVFTTKGVWASTGVLGPSNLALEKRGPWVIDHVVPPIEVPGAVLFVDILTNTVRALVYSEQDGTYVADEVSIFSDHLFLKTKVKSWAYQDGPVPLLWVVFSDGTYATFTYVIEQKMMAWTKCESGTDIEFVVSFPLSDFWSTTANFNGMLFVVNDNGERSVELGVPRYVPAATLVADSEADMGPSIAAMDSMVSWNGLMNGSLAGADVFLLAEIEDDDDEEVAEEADYIEPNLNEWEENLTLTCGTSALFPAAGLGAVGTIFRHFHPIDKTVVDLEVVSRTSDNEVIVTPSARFPSEYASGFRLYQTKATFTGLTHMNNESVAVVVDGGVVGSPNNDDEEYPVFTVSDGEITLPGTRRGAIVHVGRPYTCDIKTLQLDTVEQRPITNESKTANKVYVKALNSRGLYAGNEFPDDDKALGMQGLDRFNVDYSDDDPIIGNRYQQPVTEKFEVTVPGDFDLNGEICIRQVDPVHFEILSITSDLEELRRGK